MFKIGDFSKLSRVPVKTLRYYDELGLLKPARIDQFSSYRYYSASQLTRLNRVLALKDMGLSLEQIASLLDKEPSPEQIYGMLRLKRSELQQQLVEGKTRLERLEAWLQQFEQEALMPEIGVILKKVEALKVAQVQDTVPDWEQLGPTLNRLFDEVFSYVMQQGAKLVGPGITVYNDTEYKEQNFRVTACMNFSGNLSDGERVKVAELPSVEPMASIIHHGSFSTMKQAYKAILDWIEANGYRINGPNRELNLEYERDGDQSKFVTELQFPVEKI